MNVTRPKKVKAGNMVRTAEIHQIFMTIVLHFTTDDLKFEMP